MFCEDNSQSKNEKALVNGCIENNRAIQNQLYKLFAAKMMGVCMRYAKTKEDAEDILQEGFIGVFSCIKQFKYKGSLEGWMKKVFINCALQKLRSKRNNFLLIDIDDIPEKNSLFYIETNTIDLRLLIKYIQRLPTISRLVFNLYVFEGFKHKEISKMLGISEGTSKSNLFDARNNLRKQLKEFDFFNKSVVNE